MQQTPNPSHVTEPRPLGHGVPPAPEMMELALPAKTVSPVEIGGPPGPEPTRYGDWERNGRCVDF
jgi:hypothetical protein